jgi:hypothetical protein
MSFTSAQVAGLSLGSRIEIAAIAKKQEERPESSE